MERSRARMSLMSLKNCQVIGPRPVDRLLSTILLYLEHTTRLYNTYLFIHSSAYCLSITASFVCNCTHDCVQSELWSFVHLFLYVYKVSFGHCTLVFVSDIYPTLKYHPDTWCKFLPSVTGLWYSS